MADGSKPMKPLDPLTKAAGVVARAPGAAGRKVVVDVDALGGRRQSRKQMARGRAMANIRREQGR